MKDAFLKKFHFRRRFIVIFIVTVLISVLAVTKVFLNFYKLSKENIQAKWGNYTYIIADEMNHFLKMPMDAITFSSVTLNDMLRYKTPLPVVQSYLQQQTMIYSSIIRNNSTGVYSYFNGKYLDGSHWTPPEDYIPNIRPWYLAARMAGGRVALSKPYFNLLTSKLMMSVSKLLTDGRSVISMDVYLDDFARIIKEQSENDAVKEIFVMTDDGFVIAHSEQEKMGINLYNNGDEDDTKLLREYNGEKSKSFSLSLKNKSYTVYTEKVTDYWNVFVVLDNSNLYKSFNLLYLTFAVVLIFLLGIIIFVFFFMDKKFSESELLTRDVRAVADIYVAVIKVNLLNGDMQPIRRSKKLDYALGGSYKNYGGRILNFVDVIASDNYKAIVIEFMEPLTLEVRLSEVKTVSLEYVDRDGKWMRLRYFVIDRTQTGALHHVMIAFESIDEDRRQQEALRRLSETDLMTGVNNRGSGEEKIREAMRQEKQGMFLLIDVDKFKSINDDYGHQAGDQALKLIAESLKSVFRESDIVFRLGGDEFAAFAEGVEKEGVGKRILDRFFKKLEAADIPALNGRKVTVSVGASFFPKTEADSFEAIYQRADKGTYESKKHEGNCYTFVL